jgi:hypothetical protein
MIFVSPLLVGAGPLPLFEFRLSLQLAQLSGKCGRVLKRLGH